MPEPYGGLSRTNSKEMPPAKQKYIFTIEEGISDGGFGSSVEGLLGKPVVKIGLPCSFISHGKRELLLEKYGLTAKGIADKIKEIICPK